MEKEKSFIQPAEDIKARAESDARIIFQWQTVNDLADATSVEIFLDTFDSRQFGYEILESEILIASIRDDVPSSYLSYRQNDESLTLAVGTVFTEEITPEEIIKDLQKIISMREKLEEAGFETEVNVANEIYEIECKKEVKPDRLREELRVISDIFSQREKNNIN